MSNVVDFRPVNKKEHFEPSILNKIDLLLSGQEFNANDKKQLKQRMRRHLNSLGYKCVLSSKKVEKDWLKIYSPIVFIKEKVGFSFEISEPTRLDDSWTFYPLKAKSQEDYSALLSNITKILGDMKNG
ncbi:hypothetical protein [Shewanella oncorhynchi]|uniref:hypothetical protein n=1 Tax=Shewanella oncorhynchi TaxID=2726434 RepID=UPI003D7A8533